MLKATRKKDAWSFWRRSLQLSPRHLKEIVVASYPQFGSDPVGGLLEYILPENPEQIVKTAELIRDSNEGRLKPLFAAAEKLLDARTDELSAEEYFVKARCSEELGATDKALRAFRLALELEPSKY